MRKDSELFLKKILEYRQKVKKDSFEAIYQDYKEIPSIETAIFDILKDLIKNNCLTSQSRVTDLDGHISINLTLDGITYFDEAETKEVTSNCIFNVSGGQVNIVKDSGTINATMNNDSVNDDKKHKIESKTQEYADKWNENMFLNNFDEWDENAGVNIKLSDVYIEDHLPHFIWGQNKTESKNLYEFLYRYFDNKFVNKMLLILGQPGIGKSTLITWITANFTGKVNNNIMVYQFAADLKDIDWKKSDIFYEILKKLGLQYSDLNGNTLILDGFDEASIGRDRKEILDNIYRDLIKGRKVQNFSLIITCRENYIRDFDKVQCTYITLQPWDEEQIKSFCTCFQGKTNAPISEHTIAKLIKNKQILGIPLILYMVLALNIAVEKDGSIADIYDKIFSLYGGIYDRCIDNKNFADIHRISEIKEQIHQVSREIAIWMFENEPNEACIPQTEYEKICDGVIKESEQENEDIKQDFKIGNYFKLVKHCEGVGNEELYFVHRSIYEYFVAETFFTSICKNINKSSYKLARVLGILFKGNTLSSSKEILEFLKYKIGNSELCDKFEIINKTFRLMLKDGMTYYTKEYYKNVFKCEMNVFANMLEILHLWDQKHLKFDGLFCDYLMYNIHLNLNLKEVILYSEEDGSESEKVNLTKGAYLYGVRLTGVDLTKAILRRADLRNSVLRGTKLVETVLRGADLKNADLENADLKRANLENADLRGANLKNADLRETNLETSFWYADDIRKTFPQLEKANFDTLLVCEDNEMKEIHKENLNTFTLHLMLAPTKRYEDDTNIH